jgi:hypothetical protein
MPYTVEGLLPQLEALVAVLPMGSRRVIYLDQVVGFLVPHEAIAEIQAVRWRKVMAAFSDWWIVGLNGELACKSGSNDAFRTWMDEYRRTGTVVESGKPENMPFAEGGKPRVEPSVHDLIERTFRKMPLQAAPDKERPQDSD